MLLFGGGLLALVAGAEVFVRGASRLAALIGVSPLVIGLTVVAFGTSAPELAVALQAASQGQADLALGNVVGSNIFNFLFILGLAAVLTPLVVAPQLIRLDVPLLLVVSVGTLMLGWDGQISRGDGLILFSGILVYTFWQFWRSRATRSLPAANATGIVETLKAPAVRTTSIGLDITGRFLMIAAGLGLLVLGSRLLVEASVALARGLGVSDLVIGLTVVAAGTSLPEVATSVIAGLKGHRDIAVGNVVGSNLFNLLCVLGLSAAVSPTGILVSPAALSFDLPIMIGVVIACLPIFYSGSRIGRWEGVLLLTYYVAYTVDLILSSQGHAWLHSLRVVLGGFVIPLTSLFLFTVAYREWRQKGRVAAAIASAD